MKLVTAKKQVPATRPDPVQIAGLSDGAAKTVQSESEGPFYGPREAIARSVANLGGPHMLSKLSGRKTNLDKSDTPSKKFQSLADGPD